MRHHFATHGHQRMSDTIHRSHIATERTLLLIGYPDGSSVNLRTAKNLLRPAHFHHLKKGQHDRLKSAVDYYIKRQDDNREWEINNGEHGYAVLLDYIVDAILTNGRAFRVRLCILLDGIGWQ